MTRIVNQSIVMKEQTMKSTKGTPSNQDNNYVLIIIGGLISLSAYAGYGVLRGIVDYCAKRPNDSRKPDPQSIGYTINALLGTFLPAESIRLVEKNRICEVYEIGYDPSNPQYEGMDLAEITVPGQYQYDGIKDMRQHAIYKILYALEDAERIIQIVTEFGEVNEISFKKVVCKQNLPHSRETKIAS